MPGFNDPSLPNAQHMSPFQRYLAGVTAADSAISTETPNIDFTGQPNALDCRLCVVVKRTAGHTSATGRIKLDLYFQPKDGSALDGEWLLDRTTGFLSPGTLYTYTGLYAGKYLLRVNTLESTDPATYMDVYIAAQGAVCLLSGS